MATPLSGKTDFQQLIEQVRCGSQDAAWELVEVYGPHVQRVVRNNLSAELRARFDSVDFVQAVWQSFFARDREQHFDRPENLIAFLACVARNKVIEELRRKRPAIQAPADSDEDLVASHEPTPSKIAVAREAWSRLLARREPRDVSILQLKLMGESNQAIADRLSLKGPTVRPVMHRAFEDASHVRA